MDKLRNETIRGTGKVTEISEKLQQWYAHVLRGDENYIGKMVTSMEVEGQRRRGRRMLRWKDNIKEDMQVKLL